MNNEVDLTTRTDFSMSVKRNISSFLWLTAAYVTLLVIAAMVLSTQSSSQTTVSQMLVTGNVFWIQVLPVFLFSITMGVLRSAVGGGFKMESVTKNPIGWLIQAVLMGLFWPIVEVATQINHLNDKAEKWKRGIIS